MTREAMQPPPGFNRRLKAFSQPSPAWHDAPTVPGLWLNDINNKASSITQRWIDYGTANDMGARWYGPIPDDEGAPG